MSIPTQKDADQTLRFAFDDATDAFRVNATIVPGPPINIDHTVDSIAIGTTTELFTATDVGPAVALDVNVAQSALPTGAATSANQTTEISHLASIDANIDATLSSRASESTLSTLNAKVSNNFGATGGAVRTAAQLGNVTGAADFGAGTTSAQTVRVVLPTDQTAIPVTGTITTSPDVNVHDGSGVSISSTGSSLNVSALQSGTWNINNVSGTVSLPTGASTSALQTTGNTSLSSIDGKLNSLGQKTSANSVPVVIASDQSAISAKASTPTAGTVTQAAITVGTSAVRATVTGSAPSATRSVLIVNPDSNSTAFFYVGSSSVTSSGGTRGIQLIGGDKIAFNSDAGDYYIISDTAGQTVYIVEQA